jgi:uncharacterized protein YacL
MVKKIIGVLFIALGGFVTVSSIAQGISFLSTLMNPEQINSAYTAGFITGQVIALILFLVAAFFLIKFGLKWLKAKN